jgi:hypothetical protein
VSAAAATRNSPSIPTLCVGPLAGLSRGRYLQQRGNDPDAHRHEIAGQQRPELRRACIRWRRKKNAAARPASTRTIDRRRGLGSSELAYGFGDGVGIETDIGGNTRRRCHVPDRPARNSSTGSFAPGFHVALCAETGRMEFFTQKLQKQAGCPNGSGLKRVVVADPASARRALQRG